MGTKVITLVVISVNSQFLKVKQYLNLIEASVYAYKLMYSDRNINGNKDGKFLE